MAMFSSMLLALAVLVTTQPARPQVSLNLYSKGTHVGSKPMVVIVEVSNNSDEPVRLWQSPVGHRNAYATDVVQKQASNPSAPPYELSIVYLPDERPKLGTVLEADGGRLVPFTEVTVDPHETAYVRVQLKTDLLPLGKTTICSEMRVDETVIQSNALELVLD